jgi:hypothetical protein
MIADQIIVIETIDAMIVVDGTTRTQGTESPATRRMITSAISSRKRVTRPCTMTSPLCQAPAVCLEKGVNLDLPCALDLVLALAQAAEATKTFMLNNMIRSQAHQDNDGGHYHHPDKSNSLFATFSAPKAKRSNHPQK